MKHSFNHKVAAVGLATCLCLGVGFGLTACGKDKTPEATPQAQASAQSTALVTDPSAVDGKSALDNADKGEPSAEAPKTNKKGAVHKGESLYFLVIGEYASQDEANKALDKLGKELESQKQKNYWTALPTKSISSMKEGKYIITLAYPSQEAIDGYNALDYGQAYAQQGYTAQVVQGVFNSDEKIVVFGVDVQ